MSGTSSELTGSRSRRRPADSRCSSPISPLSKAEPGCESLWSFRTDVRNVLRCLKITAVVRPIAARPPQSKPSDPQHGWALRHHRQPVPSTSARAARRHRDRCQCDVRPDAGWHRHGLGYGNGGALGSGHPTDVAVTVQAGAGTNRSHRDRRRCQHRTGIPDERSVRAATPRGSDSETRTVQALEYSSC